MSPNLTLRRPDPYLVEVLAWTGSAVETLRYSTHSLHTRPSDVPANTFYDGLITDPGTMRRAVFENGATSGRANVDVGFIELANVGPLDVLFGYGFGRLATIKELVAADAPVSSAETVQIATVTGIESSDAPRRLRMRLRGRMAELDKPLLTERYLGTTISGDAADLIEGNLELKDVIKPHVYGSAPFCPGKLVNQFFLVYQFAANGAAQIIPYDGGLAVTIEGDYASELALIQATITPGSCATCLAKGLARFRSEPAFTVTANVVEGATLPERSASRVVERMLDLVDTVDAGDIDGDSFDDFHAFNPAEVGAYIDDDATAINWISRVADSVGGAVLDTALGIFQAVWNTGPSSTVDATLTIRELLDEGSMQLFVGPSDEGQGVPAYRVVVNYGHIWKTQGTGDLAPRISEATDGSDLAIKQLLIAESRQTAAQDLAVKTAFPLAVELTFDTLLTMQEDAEAEVARRLALYKVRRDRISFPLSFASDPTAGNVELGRSVSVVMDRFGYDLGKNFLVLGREDNRARKVRTLSLWG